MEWYQLVVSLYWKEKRRTRKQGFWDSPLCTHWHMWHTYTQPLKNTHKRIQRHMLACHSAQIVLLLLLLLLPWLFFFMFIAIYCCFIYWLICSNHVPHMLQTNRTNLQNTFNKCCKTFRPVLQSMFNKCCKTSRPMLWYVFYYFQWQLLYFLSFIYVYYYYC